jgi:hypothetical protein
MENNSNNSVDLYGSATTNLGAIDVTTAVGETGTWFHQAIVFDGTTANLYIDGE